MQGKISTEMICFLLAMMLMSCGGGNSPTQVPTQESPFGIDQVFEVQPWTGEYRVSTTIYEWEDSSREEPHTSDSNDFRELQVRLFYPTDKEYTANRLPVVPIQFWQGLGREEVIKDKDLRRSNYSNVSWYIELE